MSQPIPAGYVHLHWRDVTGRIIDTVTSRADIEQTNEPLPSCGPIVDFYLVTQGYVDDAIRAIWRIFMNHHDNWDEFLAAARRLNIPDCNAAFIFQWADHKKSRKVYTRAALQQW